MATDGQGEHVPLGRRMPRASHPQRIAADMALLYPALRNRAAFGKAQPHEEQVEPHVTPS